MTKDTTRRNGHDHTPDALVADHDGIFTVAQTPGNGENQFGLSQFNLYGTDSISDAWFGQQVMNLDWLELLES